MGALISQFPVDQAALEDQLPTLWQQWDKDESGFVSKKEFLEVENGLHAFVQRNLLLRSVEPPPVVKQHSWNFKPEDWFAFFDSNASGKLTHEQLLRALAKTNAMLPVDSAAALIDRLDLVPPGDGETITLDSFLSIHQILLEASAQSENTQLERLMQRLADKGIGASREDAQRVLEEQGGHIGRALNRLKALSGQAVGTFEFRPRP